jgi:hypothetical protein
MQEVFLKNIIDKKGKLPVFQVLLINNDASDNVEVQEAEEVNFFKVKQHLRNGGSVYITSKESQKMTYPKPRAQANYGKTRRNMGFLFRQHVRSS